MRNDSFDLRAEIDRYTSRISREIRSSRRRKEVKREYTEHIEDAVYHHMMRGMTEEKAFTAALEELGDISKIQIMLAAVHNPNRPPLWLMLPLLAVGALGIGGVYFLIEDYTLRAWYLLLLQLAALICVLFVVVKLLSLALAFHTRYRSFQKLKRYAKRNQLYFQKNANIYLSLFRRTTRPELIIETSRTRYIISLWATVQKRRVLHLSSSGIYHYSKIIGFTFFHPRGARWNVGIPDQVQDRVGVPGQMHLMPDIRFEDFASAEKENIFVLLLNPVPMNVDYVENGTLRKVSDGDRLGEMYLWATSGFLSYIDRS
ncbi:MAG: hypothetical protein E7644_08125 [Ruminococcaceae bacterium]|nr:hypothetical protein [Oscillospiraceae bacterium]